MPKQFQVVITAATLTAVASLAFAAPPAGQTPVFQNPATQAPLLPAKPKLGPCNVDLSVQRVRITRETPTSSNWLVNVAIKNVGSDAFDAPAAFTGLVVEETIGTYVHGWPAGDITTVAPGAVISMSYSIVSSTAPERSVRTFLSFGPDAPRCGVDGSSGNDQLIISGPQIAEWSRSLRLGTEVRRPAS